MIAEFTLGEVGCGVLVGLNILRNVKRVYWGISYIALREHPVEPQCSNSS